MYGQFVTGMMLHALYYLETAFRPRYEQIKIEILYVINRLIFFEDLKKK